MRCERRGTAIVTNGISRTLRTQQRIPGSNEQRWITGVPAEGIVARVQICVACAAGRVTFDPLGDTS